ncbi:MAG: hypothetical protein U1E51_01955 [Candidatus Binatia bacterium]|nr:hypothetical protein [Candidatus Binatia bacterium]
MIDTGVTGVSEQFAIELIPELGRRGLKELGEFRKNLFVALFNAVPYESVVFFFNAPPDIDNPSSQMPENLVMLQWVADHNAGFVLSGADLRRCSPDFSSCRAKMEQQIRSQLLAPSQQQTRTACAPNDPVCAMRSIPTYAPNR